MNTQHILATTLITSTLFATVSAAQAQGPLRSDTTTGAKVAKGYTLPAHILGFVAVTTATINVVGGFGITDRMLKMFRKKEAQPKGASK